MSKEHRKFDKPKMDVKVSHTKQEGMTAARNLCRKGVIVGIAITGVAFVVGTFISAIQDGQYRKTIKTKVKNG